MKLILITDLHIGLPEEDTHGVDVRTNFLNILEEIKKEQPDHIVIAGDLCFMKGERAVYEWIRRHMDTLMIPYDLIAGNHDDSILLAEEFDRTKHVNQDTLYYKKRLENWDAYFLDTASRSLSEAQLNWMQAELANNENPVIVFMHHPPMVSGIPFMDTNHGLTNMKAVQTAFATYKGIIPVFTGHYHNEKTVVKGNLVLQITPACFFQIDYRIPEFRVDHYKIAYRQIDLSEHTWQSTVRYFNGTKL